MTWRRLCLILTISFLAVSTKATKAQNAPRNVSIEYTLSATHPVSHLYDIQMDIRGIRTTTIDVAMPAWAPGEYRIREFARNVQEFSAGKLAWKQLDKQTWRITKPANDDVQIHYRVYSNDLSDEMADIAGPATFLYVVGNTRAPVRVKYEIPAKWNVYGSLDKNGDWYAAADYDTLADSPTFLGNLKVVEFTNGAGVVHRIVFSNPKVEFTERQVVQDLRDLTDAEVPMFGPAPYARYTFLVKVRGGVTGTESFEHQGSARMTVGENDFVAQASYRRFIAGASRALVRSWIGKKIRPAGIEPMDYSKETYSRLLWFMDGASSYYADLLQVRSGFLAPEEYYAKAESDISALQHQAGRQSSSLEDASMNAWLRSDNSALNTFSYSAKGAIAALMLDMEIRGRTAGQANPKSLNDVVRYLATNYGAKGIGVPEDGIQKAVNTVAGSDFTGFFDKVVRGTMELDYNSSLQYGGLQVDFHRLESNIYFGVEWSRSDNNQVRIARVAANSPAERAELDAGDILIALDNDRITADNMVNRIHARRVGTPVSITFLRGERLMTTQLTPGETHDDNCSFFETPTAKPQQIQIRKAWLGQ